MLLLCFSWHWGEYIRHGRLRGAVGWYKTFNQLGVCLPQTLYILGSEVLRKRKTVIGLYTHPRKRSSKQCLCCVYLNTI